VLAEVTLAMQEGYPDYGQAEIGGSAQGVSGKDTETTAISGLEGSRPTSMEK